MSDKPRRPYLDIDRSYVDMIKSPARYLMESGKKESVFEKPYLDKNSNYRRMHLNIPSPDWPTWDGDYHGINVPWVNGRISLKAEDDKGNCVLRSTEWFFDEADCSGRIEVYLKHYSTKCFGCDGKWFKVASTKGVRIETWLGPPRPGASVDFHLGTEAVDGDLIAILGFEDYKGNRCTIDIRRSCENTECTETTEISWDWDSSAQTVTSGSTVNIYVLDGVPPFEWNIDEANFTIGSQKTTARSNTVKAETGSCGVCTIRVKDACENICTGYVRNTTSGRWSLSPEHEVCALPGVMGTLVSDNWPTTAEYEAIQGKYKQTDIIYSPGGCACSESPCDCEDWCDGYGYCLSGDLGCDMCLDPDDSERTPPGYLGDNEGSSWWYAVCNRTLDVREWECP